MIICGTCRVFVDLSSSSSLYRGLSRERARRRDQSPLDCTLWYQLTTPTMAKKRKRPGRHPPIANKPLSLNPRTANNNNPTHPVISLYYPHVLTLRQYLLRQLPVSSKLRRRRIASLSVATAAKDKDHRWSAHVPDLVHLLDTTLVGVLHESPPTISQERRRDLAIFTESQSQSQSQPQSESQLGSTSAQSEVCELAPEL